MVDFRLKELSFTYPEATEPALKNISLDISSGDFIVVAGKSGSGKSTLLRMLKPQLSPHGTKNGEIFYFGKEEKDFSLRESAENIGYLLQNPEYQTVTHSVRTELAFGLENLGLDSRLIRLRIAEISAYFSLEGIIDKKISELSGGQKQLVCLAGILAMHPRAVIFDEPTSQLDPTAAELFVSTISKLCRDNGITVIISEHRLENIIPLADRLVILEKGEIISDCHPSRLSSRLSGNNEFINASVTAPMQIFSRLGIGGELPLTVAQGRKAMEKLLGGIKLPEFPAPEKPQFSSEAAVEANGLYFSYDKKKYVLNNFSVSIPKGTFFAVFGANGAGKSTAVSLMSGLLPCKTGSVSVFGKSIKKYKESELYNGIIAVMPQKCETMFSRSTVREELENMLSGSGLSAAEKENEIMRVARITKTDKLLQRHPYDVSGGEMQRAALAMILLKKPKIIFMDEPTKGMDCLFKKEYARLIKELCADGVTVIAVSHDTEFCAEHADICAMISDGRCITQADARTFFSSSFFYTTAASKTAREFFPQAVTSEEVVSLCRKSLPV